MTEKEGDTKTVDEQEGGSCKTKTCPFSKRIGEMGLGCAIRAAAIVFIVWHLYEFYSDLRYGFEGTHDVVGIIGYYVAQLMFYPFVLIGIARLVDRADGKASCGTKLCSTTSCSEE